MHICDLRTCTFAICGRAHTLCERAHTRFADVRICTSGICGRAIVSTWLQRVCHVVTTCLPRGCHVATTWKQLHRVCARPQIPDVHERTSSNRVCARPQIPDVHMCMSANCVCARPQIPDVYVRIRQTNCLENLSVLGCFRPKFTRLPLSLTISVYTLAARY